MATIVVIITTVILIFIVILGDDNESTRIKKRLESISNEKKVETLIEKDLMEKSFTERVILPLLKKLSKKSSKKKNQAKREQLKKMLAQAGNPLGLNVDEFLALKGIFTLILLFSSLVFCFFYKLAFIHYILAIMISLNLSILIPNLYLKRKIQYRKKQIIKKLPDVLDLLTVSVEAGLAFDSAMAKVVEKFRGPLSDEFKIVLNEIKLGKKRRYALKEMAERMDVEDLSNFISSLIQAEQLGVSIGNVLRIQSNQARQRRRQRTEELAMKAPVKMLLPLVGCIFPTIFLIIFAPIIMSVYKVFKKNNP